jgi:hypothetical protein
MKCGYENQVLVTIDTDKYTIADFRQNFDISMVEDTAQRMEMINEYVNRLLVIKEARKKGYEDDPIVRISFEERRKMIITNSYYEENVVKKVNVSDAEVKDIYDQFVERYHLAFIAVNEESLVQYVHSELKKGVPFDSLLRFSIDTLSESGDIGEVTGLQIPSEMYPQLKKTKIGEVTTPIKFGENFYILKVIDHKKVDEPTFDKMKEFLKNDKMQAKLREKAEELSKTLYEKAKIEFNEEALNILIKPDSLITEADLNTWVVKKYDTSYVYVKTIRNAIITQYRKSFIDPKYLIDRELIKDLVYDAAMKAHFDKKSSVKKKLQNDFDLLLYRKLYNESILDKATVDSMEVVAYYNENRDRYKDKKLDESYSMLKTILRDTKIDSLRRNLFAELRETYKPEINEVALKNLLEEEKKKEEKEEK